MLHSQSPPASAGPMNAFENGPCVTAIGSCRVLAPLKEACRIGGARLNQSGVYGYCHSSTEAVQQITHLQNGTAPPAWLRPIVAPSSTSDDEAGVGHTPSDLYFVELSSSKILTVDDHAIQLNYLTRHLRGFFADHERSRLYWRLLRADDQTALREMLAADEVYLSLSEADREMLAKLRLTLTTPDILRRDLAQIEALLPNFIIVTHFDAAKRDGTLLSARADYLAMLRRVLRETRLTWFDPSDYVSAFGQRGALEHSDSLSHYSSEFVDLLALNWATRYINPIRHSPQLTEALRGRIQKNATRRADLATAT